LNVGRLWWITTRRRWQEEIAPALILLSVTFMHGSAALATVDPATAPIEILLVFCAALAAALFVSMAMPGGGPLASLRFDLLPWTSAHFFMVRLWFAQPLRTLLALSALLWTGVALLRLPVPTGAAMLALLAVTAATAAGLMLVQVAEDALMRRRALGVLRLLSMIGLGGLIVLLSPNVVRELARAPPPWVRAASADWLAATGPGMPTVAATTASLIALLAAGWLSYQLAPRHTAPAAPARAAAPGGGATLALVRIAGNVVPAAPAAFGREVASLIRPGRTVSGFVITFALAAAAFRLGVPWLITAALLLWAMWTPNLLGVDLLLGGRTRMELLPVPLARTLRLRHAAVLLLVSSSVAAAGVVMALAGVWRSPVVAGGSHALYLVALLYGAGLFLLATLPGDRLAMRFAFWYDFATRQRIGRQPPLLAGMLGTAVFLMLAAIAAAVGIVATRLLWPDAGPSFRIGAVLVTASLVALLLYAAVPAAGKHA
jgi:hypothetical protein